MSKDPILNRIVQPIVDRLGFDPRPPAERLADIFMLAAITMAVVNVAVFGRPNVWLASGMHIIGAHFVRRVCLDTARNGPAMLLVNPHGLFHAILRIMMIYSVIMGVATLAAVSGTKTGVALQIMLFRGLLDLTESILALASLYLGMCRRPPPRRRNESLRHSRA